MELLGSSRYPSISSTADAVVAADVRSHAHTNQGSFDCTDTCAQRATDAGAELQPEQQPDGLAQQAADAGADTHALVGPDGIPQPQPLADAFDCTDACAHDATPFSRSDGRYIIFDPQPDGASACTVPHSHYIGSYQLGSSFSGSVRGSGYCSYGRRSYTPLHCHHDGCIAFP